MTRQPDQIKDGRPPFIMIEEAVIRNHKLTAHQIAAYVVLVMHANHKDGDKAFPSHKTIGEMGGMSARQARRSVDTLAEMKLISITHVFDEKTKAQKSNIYTILPVTPVARQATPRGRMGQGRRTGGPAPVATQANKPDELNQMKEKNVAAATQADPELKVVAVEKPRDVIFDALALGSFGIAIGTKVSSETASRVGLLKKWLKKNYAGANELTVAAFYRWYDSRESGASRPRDVKKFASAFDKFHAEVDARKNGNADHSAKMADLMNLHAYEASLNEKKGA
jgi:hypothetical protein